MLRQYLLLIALMFWQGGFMFYGGVVVPVGSHVLGSDTAQGFITQKVTNYLNLAGAACLCVWAENLWYARKTGVSKWECIGWAIMVLLLMVLVAVHLAMDQVLDSSSKNIVNLARFGLFHKTYIGTSSVQWAVCLAALIFTLKRWNSMAAR